MGKLGSIVGMVLIAVGVSSSAAPRRVAGPPKPIIQFAGASVYSAGGKDWVRHRYVVANRSRFAADLFAAAPDLPPCGLNANSSRTWIDFYEASGKRLYGFCALKKLADLKCLWFASEFGATPPARIYLELTDRRTGKRYRSNLARTGPPRPAAAATAAANAAAAKARCPFAMETKA